MTREQGFALQAEDPPPPARHRARIGSRVAPVVGYSWMEGGRQETATPQFPPVGARSCRRGNAGMIPVDVKADAKSSVATKRPEQSCRSCAARRCRSVKCQRVTSADGADVSFEAAALI